MKGFKWVSGAVLAAFVLPLLAQTADDPAIGTWKLNTAKSVVPASIGVKGMTRVYTHTPAGLSLTETQELTAGGSNTVTYSFRYDGKDSPVTGSSLYDSLAVKEVAKGKTDSVLKLKGATVGHSEREISKDGKVMSLTTMLKVNGKEETIKY